MYFYNLIWLQWVLNQTTKNHQNSADFSWTKPCDVLKKLLQMWKRVVSCIPNMAASHSVRYKGSVFLRMIINPLRVQYVWKNVTLLSQQKPRHCSSVFRQAQVLGKLCLGRSAVSESGSREEGEEEEKREDGKSKEKESMDVLKERWRKEKRQAKTGDV